MTVYSNITLTCSIIHHVFYFFVFTQGVIRDDKDLDMLGPEFKETYRKRQVDPYDEDAWEGKN